MAAKIALQLKYGFLLCNFFYVAVRQKTDSFLSLESINRGILSSMANFSIKYIIKPVGCFI